GIYTFFPFFRKHNELSFLVNSPIEEIYLVLPICPPFCQHWILLLNIAIFIIRTFFTLSTPQDRGYRLLTQQRFYFLYVSIKFIFHFICQFQYHNLSACFIFLCKFQLPFSD